MSKKALNELGIRQKKFRMRRMLKNENKSSKTIINDTKLLIPDKL